MELSERIIFARERAGMKQHHVADLLSLTQQAIQSWEKGNSSPRLPRLQKLAEVLDVSEEWLSTGQGSFKRNKETDEDDQKVTDDIMHILDQLEGEDKKDALKILENMAENRQLLNKHGVDQKS